MSFQSLHWIIPFPAFTTSQWLPITYKLLNPNHNLQSSMDTGPWLPANLSIQSVAISLSPPYSSPSDVPVCPPPCTLNTWLIQALCTCICSAWIPLSRTFSWHASALHSLSLHFEYQFLRGTFPNHCSLKKQPDVLFPNNKILICLFPVLPTRI